MINGVELILVVDSGSGMSIMLKRRYDYLVAQKQAPPPWKGRKLTAEVLDGKKFNMLGEVKVTVAFGGVKSKVTLSVASKAKWIS